MLLVIFDEFDRLTDQLDPANDGGHDQGAVRPRRPRNRSSSSASPIRLASLIAEHESIDRSLTQIPMPRMELDELYELLDKGMQASWAWKLEPKARQKVIAGLSQGLPPYTHRLALHATRAAIRAQAHGPSRTADVKHAIKDAVENAQQSLRDNYRKAISSPQSGNLFGQVLLACATSQDRRLRLLCSGRRKEADVEDHEKAVTRFRASPGT